MGRLGEELSAGTRAALDAHARLLLAWNKHINLTALRSAEQVATGHVLDSLTGLYLLRRLAPAGRRRSTGRPRLLDLGSGAGYPGLPLALALPAGRCALVDAVGKKARFLETVVRAVAETAQDAGESPPALTALAARAEDLAREPDHRAAWDVVLVRAVGSLSEVAELGLPLLAVGGQLIAWKRDAGGSLATELASAGALLRAAGGSRPIVELADPTGSLGLADHRLVTIRKLRRTPDRFPRSPAERRPPALLT